jgi:hypothetical protein
VPAAFSHEQIHDVGILDVLVDQLERSGERVAVDGGDDRETEGPSTLMPENGDALLIIERPVDDALPHTPGRSTVTDALIDADHRLNVAPHRYFHVTVGGTPCTSVWQVQAPRLKVLA